MDDFWSGVGVDLHLETDGNEGRRAGLERALRDAVRGGRLAPGTRLPHTRRLATEVGISRNTVKAAYDQLVAEGYLTARQGSGTRVAALPSAAAEAPAATARARVNPASTCAPAAPTSAPSRRRPGCGPCAARSPRPPRWRTTTAIRADA